MSDFIPMFTCVCISAYRLGNLLCQFFEWIAPEDV